MEPAGRPVKTFRVFGELVEVFTRGEETGGLSATLTQTSPPGGGPPLHHHLHEDETFFVLSGEYEFVDGDRCMRLGPGGSCHVKRGGVHTFRNVGSTEGRMLAFISPAGIEAYLEEISALEMPRDAARLEEISARYGVSYPARAHV